MASRTMSHGEEEGGEKGQEKVAKAAKAAMEAMEATEAKAADEAKYMYGCSTGGEGNKGGESSNGGNEGQVGRLALHPSGRKSDWGKGQYNWGNNNVCVRGVRWCVVCGARGVVWRGRIRVEC